jgi:hypothetical protein
MGLLDDAIREHLELKRRHGADPSEVERQEQEALGPARRGAAAPPLGAREDEAGAVSAFDEDDESAGYDDEDDDDEPERSVPAGEPEAPVAPPAPEPEDGVEVLDADDVSNLDPEPPPEAELSGSGTRGEPAEDVLEETPDFLQETPEHDRLWFEQKPPRDFEF